MRRVCVIRRNLWGYFVLFAEFVRRFCVICRIYEAILCRLPNLWGDFVLFAEFMRRFVSFAEFLRGFSVIYHTRSYRVPRSEEDLLPRTAFMRYTVYFIPRRCGSPTAEPLVIFWYDRCLLGFSCSAPYPLASRGLFLSLVYTPDCCCPTIIVVALFLESSLSSMF